MRAAEPTHNIVGDIGKLLSALVEVLQKLKQLFQREWQLAEKSIPIIILLGMLVFVGLIGTWLAFFITASLLLQNLLHNWLHVSLIILTANLLLSGLLLMMLANYSRNLHFSHTRKQLSQWRATKNDANKSLEKTH